MFYSLQEDEDNDMDVSDDNSMNSMSDNDSVGMLNSMSYFFSLSFSFVCRGSHKFGVYNYKISVKNSFKEKKSFCLTHDHPFS